MECLIFLTEIDVNSLCQHDETKLEALFKDTHCSQ